MCSAASCTGVLAHLRRDFDRAAAAFRAALELSGSDYSLWNKLGATLANSARAAAAVGAYQKALSLKPNYMRAWINMGIRCGALRPSRCSHFIRK